MTKRILVVGSLNLDFVAEAERLPLPGETVRGCKFDHFNGGKGANQAVVIARLGFPVDMIGCVGDDWAGQMLLKGLAEAGVDTRAVDCVPGSSGIAIIVRTSKGENSIVVVGGANEAMSEARVDRQAEKIRQSTIVLTQLEIPMQAVDRLAHIAWDAQVPFMLDPAPAAGLSPDLLRRVTWLTPNEIEAQRLLGSTVDSPAKMATQLLGLGVRNVALKLGALGVFLAGHDCNPQLVPAIEVDAVDTTAAGDCFNAAFAAGLARGASPEIAAGFAVAAAALSVTRTGAQPSMPTCTEVEDFLTSRSTSSGMAPLDGSAKLSRQ